MIQSGCDKSKIVVGLPAYARHKDSPKDVRTYSEIIEEIHTTKLPTRATLFSKNEHMEYLFDSPVIIKDKVKMAFEKGLKGVFMWEIGQDYYFDAQYPGGYLIQSASEAKADLISSRRTSSNESESNDEL